MRQVNLSGTPTCIEPSQPTPTTRCLGGIVLVVVVVGMVGGGTPGTKSSVAVSWVSATRVSRVPVMSSTNV